MPVYAVTGASGHLGRFAVQSLLSRGVPPSEVAAVVRTAGGAADLAARGVQVRVADYSRPQTPGPALDGVDRLLLVSGNEPGQRVIQHTNVIGAARMAGVSRVVFTRMLNADRASLPNRRGWPPGVHPGPSAQISQFWAWPPPLLHQGAGFGKGGEPGVGEPSSVAAHNGAWSQGINATPGS